MGKPPENWERVHRRQTQSTWTPNSSRHRISKGSENDDVQRRSFEREIYTPLRVQMNSGFKNFQMHNPRQRTEDLHLAIDSAAGHLWGYPHGVSNTWAEVISGALEEVALVFERWPVQNRARN